MFHQQVFPREAVICEFRFYIRSCQKVDEKIIFIFFVNFISQPFMVKFETKILFHTTRFIKFTFNKNLILIFLKSWSAIEKLHVELVRVHIKFIWNVFVYSFCNDVSELCELHEKALCNNGECISKTSLCDRSFDCFDKSDEMNCRKYIFSRFSLGKLFYAISWNNFLHARKKKVEGFLIAESQMNWRFLSSHEIRSRKMMLNFSRRKEGRH